MEKIKTIGVDREYKIPTAADPTMEGGIRVTAKFVIPLPQDLEDASSELANSYKKLFSIDELTEDGNIVFIASVSTNIFKNGNQSEGLTTLDDIKALLEAEYTVYETKLAQFQKMPFDPIIGQAWDGTIWQPQIPVPPTPPPPPTP